MSVQMEPYYEFTDINEPISLYRGLMVVDADCGTSEVDAHARLRLLPTPRIIFETVYETGKVSHSKSGVLRLDGHFNFSVDAFAIKVTTSLHDNARAVWVPRREPVPALGNDVTEMSKVAFHLMNFREYMGKNHSSAKLGRTMFAIQRLELRCNDWRVEIHSQASTSSITKQLMEQGGYGLTHVGMAWNQSGAPFTGHQATDVLTALGYFLSFANGQSCKAILPVGFTDEGDRCWAVWNSPYTSLRSAMSWCDDHTPQQLPDLFSGFMKRWKDESWREALQEALSWYLKANNSRAGLDSGIILTQTAIERLSYEYAVNDRKLIELDGFKKLRASDKLRLLLSSLDIPIEIPSPLDNLDKLSKKYGWLDSPHALTEMRNSLVHPEHKRRGQFEDAMFDAWNLGLYFLELTILRLCGYHGKYSNRLVSKYVGEVEPVPWEVEASYA